MKTTRPNSQRPKTQANSAHLNAAAPHISGYNCGAPFCLETGRNTWGTQDHVLMLPNPATSRQTRVRCRTVNGDLVLVVAGDVTKVRTKWVRKMAPVDLELPKGYVLLGCAAPAAQKDTTPPVAKPAVDPIHQPHPARDSIIALAAQTGDDFMEAFIDRCEPALVSSRLASFFTAED